MYISSWRNSRIIKPGNLHINKSVSGIGNKLLIMIEILLHFCLSCLVTHWSYMRSFKDSDAWALSSNILICSILGMVWALESLKALLVTLMHSQDREGIPGRCAEGHSVTEGRLGNAPDFLAALGSWAFCSLVCKTLKSQSSDLTIRCLIDIKHRNVSIYLSI